MDIVQATHEYETWMARQTTVVGADVDHKHAVMAKEPFRFLRGTFYRWVQRWQDVCPSLADAPTVLAVGDVHVENFGTWRDAEGRLVWGINDLDEACCVPYTNDLVRLATSAALAIEESHFVLGLNAICDSILEGYTSALERGGRPIVLAERHTWLREIAVHQLRDPKRFWIALAANPAVTAPAAVIRRLALPKDATDRQVLSRRAGVGSLGRPRYLALAMYDGGLIGREAKAVIPSAVVWASGHSSAIPGDLELSHRAVRAADPFFVIDGRWSVRRLSPDCSKINMSNLPRGRDDTRLLRAMGWELANLHLGTPKAAIAKDLRRRPSGWLRSAARKMAVATIEDYRVWRRGMSRRTDIAVTDRLSDRKGTLPSRRARH